MKQSYDAIMQETINLRKEAKKQPVTLEELDKRQAQMNSPAWYASISFMGSKGTALYPEQNA